MELKALGDKAKLPHGMTSFLNPPNLLAALEVVGQPLPHPDETCNEDLKRLMVANFVPKNSECTVETMSYLAWIGSFFISMHLLCK